MRLAVFTPDSTLPLALLFPGLLVKMLKIPRFCEIRKLVRSKLRPVVAHHLVWYAIEGKMTLQLQNGGAGFGVWQSVHLPEVAIVVYCDRVIPSIEVKDVCGNLFPRMGRDIVGHQCLLGEGHAVELPTCFACENVLFHFCRYAWAVNAFTCTPQTCFYSEVERVNLHLLSKPAHLVRSVRRACWSKLK